MAQIVKVEIEINGQKVVKPFSQVIINQSMDWHHSFQVKCPMEVLGNFQKSLEHVGQPIKISIKSELNKNSKGFFFKGIITKISLLKYKGTTGDILIQGYSPSILLDDGENCTTFEKMGLGDIAGKITKSYPANLLSSKVSVNYTTQIPFVFQYKESNYRFLKRMAQLYGEWFFYDGGDLIFGAIKPSNQIKLKFGSDLSDFDISMAVAPDGFKEVTYDYFNHKTYTSPSANSVDGLDSNGKKALDASNKLYSNKPVVLNNQVALSGSDLEQFTKARQSGVAGDMVFLEGTSDNQEIRIGTEIEVEGSGESAESFGKYIVIEARHSSDGVGNYQNHFKAVQSTLKMAPYFSQRVADPEIETQNAEVIDNNDPDGLGRVKVKFVWQVDGGTCPWIRVLSSSSGKDKGFYFIPEIKDHVLVAFEDGNPNKPFILGAVFHKDTKPSLWKDDKNNKKGLKTKSGNEILFLDEDGKETITIQQKDKKNEFTITLEGDGKITLKTKGDILFKADKSITMEAGEEINIKSTKGTTIKADELKVQTQKDVEVKGGMNVKVQANQSIELKATTELKMEGLSTSLKASTKGEIKASAMLDIDGGAMANLKGALVKIN